MSRRAEAAIGRRWLRFNAAGAAGAGVQLAALWLLTGRWGLPHLPATTIAVGAALLHNFVWHWRWTWRERALDRTTAAAALGRFVVVNGLVSIAGNLAIGGALVDGAGMPAIPANAIAIASCGLINFWLADRAVFVSRSGGRSAGRCATRATPAPPRRRDSPAAAPLSLR